MREPGKYESEWRQMRDRSMGELLEIKFSADNDYLRELAQMELDRRKFVREVWFDRVLAVTALIISIIALFASR